MTSPEVQPTMNEIVVEAVQYTPGRDPVIVQWSGKKPGGPLSGSRLFHTTQTALAGERTDSKTDLRAVQWTDDPIETALVAHLAEFGIAAVIIREDPSEKTAEPAEATAIAAVPTATEKTG